MSEDNIFSFVKEAVKLSDFVKTLPSLTSITPTGGGKWRCNNVIAEGSNPTSMVLDDRSGFFKAFSHEGEHGDVITLYQLTLGNTQDSVATQAAGLAQHMGIAVDEKLLNNAHSHGVSKHTLIEAMNTIVDRAHKYLYEDHEDAKKCLGYLHDRGMEDDLIEQWRIGAFPSTTAGMGRITEGIPTEVLQKIGIASMDNPSFIAMRGRVVFPIFSPAGDGISLSSRAIDQVDTPLPGSKYINTSATPIYDKSATLYGQHLITRDAHTVLICEGNFDVIALNALVPEGVVAVATCGTALTTGHVSMLAKRKNITTVNIMFDHDEAGRNATASALWLHNHWDNVSSIDSPGGKDPWDNYISGVTYDQLEHNKQPLMLEAVEHKFSTLTKSDFLQWCSDAQATLNFSDDREMLLADIREVSGVSRTSIISSGRSLEPYSAHGDTQDGLQLSSGMLALLPPLLAMNHDTRKIVAYPLVAKPLKDYALSVCGVDGDKEASVLGSVITNVRQGVDKKMLAQAYSLHPPEDEASYDYRFIARHLARLLLFSWHSDRMYTPVVEYIPVVQSISSGKSGADGLDQLSFIFEAIAATAA